MTLLGPDAKGNAVVFTDGMPGPLPARVLAEAPTATEPEPVARVSMNGAEDEVPRWYATRHARIQWIPLLTMATLIGALAYDLSRPIPGLAFNPLLVAAWFAAALVLVPIVIGLVRMLDQLRLPKLLAAGQWQAYPVTIGTWKGDPRTFADLTLRMSLPDGGSLPVLVKHAPVELVANVSATGTLWVIGTPEARKLTAAGVPGHPIVAPARFV